MLTSEPCKMEKLMEDLDELREKSMRASAVHEDVEGVVIEDGGGFMSQYTSGQRLILAVLLLLDIFVVGYVLLAIFGVV